MSCCSCEVILSEHGKQILIINTLAAFTSLSGASHFYFSKNKNKTHQTVIYIVLGSPSHFLIIFLIFIQNNIGL